MIRFSSFSTVLLLASFFSLLGVMIPRLVNAFPTRGVGLKAVPRITRLLLSTSDKSNLQQKDEIKSLKDEIAELKRNLLMVVDSGERIAVRNQITANTNFLNTLTTHQGTFVTPISLRPFRSLLITHPFYQMSFKISTSPFSEC